MFHKDSVRVKSFDIFNILEIQFVEVFFKFNNFFHTFEYKIPNFPRKMNELFFLFFMKKVQPKVIFPCKLCNKHYVIYMPWYKEGRIFLGPENPNDIVILHLFQSPNSIQEFTSLSRYSWGISSKQQLCKNQDKVIENFIKCREYFFLHNAWYQKVTGSN
jgi:hypothetical protein